MIYLYSPYAGLGNRIRAILSGMALAKELEQKFVILWRKDETLNCDFYELFERNCFFKVQNFSWYLLPLEFSRSKNKVKKILSKLIQWFLKIDFVLFDDDFPSVVWNNYDFKFNPQTLPKHTRNLYISTCNEFYYDNHFLDFLKPTKKLQDLISEISPRFSNTIGIHIRRTDHLSAIEQSPLPYFVDAIEKEIKTNPGVTFYLATDDPLVESSLAGKFPQIFFLKKTVRNRNNCQAIKDAMLDLYCLSKTKKIYGSFESSFSEVAAKIGSVPLEIVRKNE